MYNMSDEEFEKIRDTIVRAVGAVSDFLYIGYKLEKISDCLVNVFDIEKCKTFEDFQKKCEEIRTQTDDYGTYFNDSYECDQIWDKNPMLYINIGLEYLRQTNRVVKIPNEFLARDLAWQGIECLIKIIIDGVLSDGNNQEDE